MKKYVLIAILLIVGASGRLLTYHAGSETDMSNVDSVQTVADTSVISEKIPAQAFEEKYQTGEYVVLDVRTSDEYQQGTIYSDALSIDYYAPDFRAQLDMLDKNTPYLIHCRSGNRSGKTLPIMKELGFTEVYDLTGGKIAWEQSGRVLVAGDSVQ